LRTTPVSADGGARERSHGSRDGPWLGMAPKSCSTIAATA
jgi:hypothetical protein